MLQLAAFTLVASSIAATTAALAASLTVKPDSDHNAVQSYSAAKQQPLPSSVQSDLPLAIWAAAQALASHYPDASPKQGGLPPQPNTVVINGATLGVEPGAWPTPILPFPSRTRTTLTPTSSVTTTSSSTSTSSSSTPMPTPSHLSAHHHGPSEKLVAGAIGAFLILIALGLMAIVFWMLWRRKNTTGSYFKPVRYSIASVAAKPPKDRIRGEMRTNPETSSQPEEEEGLTQEANQEQEEDEDEDEAAPGPIIPYHNRTSRGAEGTPPNYATFPPSRRSVERLRTRRLVSSRSRDNVQSAELTSDTRPAELDSTPSLVPSSRVVDRLWSPRASDGDVTPRATTSRPLVVMHSPTTSSSDMFASRTESRGDSHGESRDVLAPITPPYYPSYRDRRPLDLKLPTANSRFRDQRLSPMVHLPDESSRSPGISPLIQGQSPRTPSPRYRDRSQETIVHYPSHTEISGFDFTGKGSSRAPGRRDGSSDRGDDGWRRDGDKIFGRYELG